jgi:hypothetical protein
VNIPHDFCAAHAIFRWPQPESRSQQDDQETTRKRDSLRPETGRALTLVMAFTALLVEMKRKCSVSPLKRTAESTHGGFRSPNPIKFIIKIHKCVDFTKAKSFKIPSLRIQAFPLFEEIEEIDAKSGLASPAQLPVHRQPVSPPHEVKIRPCSKHPTKRFCPGTSQT